MLFLLTRSLSMGAVISHGATYNAERTSDAYHLRRYEAVYVYSFHKAMLASRLETSEEQHLLIAKTDR